MRFPLGIGILFLCIVPIIVNLLVKLDFLPFVFGEGKDWLGFFGGYFGGAVVAVYVARLQVENAKKDFQAKMDSEHKIRQEENRIYTTLSWEFADWNLKDVENESAQIIYTYDYKRREISLDTEKSNATTFALLKFFGSTQFVTNCEITLYMNSFEKELIINNNINDGSEHLPKLEDGKMEFIIPFITVDETMYIPITNVYLKATQERNLCVHRAYDVSKVTIEYTTPLLERIRFISDIEQQKESYILVTKDREVVIMESEMQNIVWKYPKRKIYDGKA